MTEQAQANGGGMDESPIAHKDWWLSVPEEERALYQKAGYGSRQGIAGKTALIAIDVTKFFTGSRPAPIQEAIKEYSSSCGDAAWQALPHVRELLDAFRAAGLPVVYTARDVEAQAAAKGSTKRIQTNAARRDHSGNSWVELVEPAEDEWVCTKARASAFYGTTLDAYLRINQVRTVVICGGTTSGCVRASSADAYSAGFEVVVAEDACFDRARTPHLANLFDLNAKYATVLATGEIVEAVREPVAQL